MGKRYRAVLVGIPSRSDAPWSMLVADDDVDALAQVHRLLGPSAAFELYQDQRLVRRHRSPSSDQRPEAPDRSNAAPDHPHCPA